MKPFDIVFKVLGAIYDPARGSISLTRTTAVTFLGLAALGAGDATTTTQLIETGIYAAAGIGALAVRGRKDPTVQK